MSVADRLRVESEQALGLLQDSHRAVEEQLSQALGRLQEKEKELDGLRGEHRDVCRQLSDLTLQQQQEQSELHSLRNVCKVKDKADCDEQTERRDSEEGKGLEMEEVMEEAEAQTDSENVNKQQIDNEAKQDVQIDGHDTEDENGSSQLTGKGVAEGYLRKLAAQEKKKEEGRGQRDPRKLVMLSERSW